MTENLLALVPLYGHWLIFSSLLLSCMAIPVPSSILVMAAGGFAAAGDLIYWQLVLTAWAGFVTGDQIAYNVARLGGRPLVEHVRRQSGSDRVVESADGLLTRFGLLAVFLSRTVFSPLGPYVSFLSGALRFSWLSFSCASMLGSLVWSLSYAGIGFLLAGRIAELASLIANWVGVFVAGVLALSLMIWLMRSWKNQQHQRE